MRMMSFSLITDAVVRRQKTVTRRSVSTWIHLQPGDRIQAVDKVMGLRKGQRPQPLAVIEVVSVRVEPLTDITDDDVIREGFEGHGRTWFIDMYALHAKMQYPNAPVRRIEFRYVEL